MDEALIKNLGIKPGMRVCVINPPEGYVERLGSPEGVELAFNPDGTFDVVHLFVDQKEDLDREAAVTIAALRPGGRLWISYPKRSSKVATDMTRDRGWDAVTDAGLVGVTQISIDDVWSALRFRPAEEVGKRG